MFIDVPRANISEKSTAATKQRDIAAYVLHLARKGIVFKAIISHLPEHKIGSYSVGPTAYQRKKQEKERQFWDMITRQQERDMAQFWEKLEWLKEAVTERKKAIYKDLVFLTQQEKVLNSVPQKMRGTVWNETTDLIQERKEALSVEEHEIQHFEQRLESTKTKARKAATNGRDHTTWRILSSAISHAALAAPPGIRENYNDFADNISNLFSFERAATPTPAPTPAPQKSARRPGVLKMLFASQKKPVSAKPWLYASKPNSGPLAPTYGMF